MNVLDRNRTATPVIRELAPGDHPGWDEYVLRHPQGSPFHLIAWKKTVETVFRYQPRYLLATDGDRITGVLPLFLVHNIFLGKVLISTPFAVYGGILADSPAVRIQLLEYARERGKEAGAKYIELRNAWEEQCSGLPRIDRYVTFNSTLSADPKEILESIPRKTRAAVRKSLKGGLESRITRSDRSSFEDLYTKSLRRHGTPCFPRNLFSTLFENFGEMADIREVTANGKVVAAVLSFYFRDQVLPYYGAWDPQTTAYAPNNFMYYDLMRWASQNGYRVFDFGRSKKVPGSYDFKSRWAMVERELPYEFVLIWGKHGPSYSAASPSFQLLMACWRRLPLALTRALGPFLIRYVP